ncbi:hypothetical protein FRC07_008577 [Ceratobasidium sp. 392]|nr:hypothetical protein FRC07_008577 [Ceratobasidium sp. 392]
MSTLTEWKAARKLLTDAIQSYLAASTILRTSCTALAYRTTGRSPAEDALATLDSELESLALEEALLRDTRISLTVTRNTSVRLTRINALPPEILARIFGLSKTYCQVDDSCSPDNFASVCAYWRKVAIDTAGLWTHIDIGPSAPESLTELLLERSGSAPIHIHVLEPSEDEDVDDFGDPSDYVAGCTAAAMLAMLNPQLHCIRSLNIESNSNDGEIISAIFKKWFENGSFGFPSVLSIERPMSRRTMFIPIQAETSELERRLLAIRTLHLDCVNFGWASSAYRDLVDLRLYFFRTVATSKPQLFNILSACPTLHTLKLRNIKADNTEDWVQPDPILMPHLEVLNLAGMGPNRVAPVLSLVTLPNPQTELSVEISPTGAIDNQLTECFFRSNINILYCHYPSDRSYHDWSTEQLSSD